MSVHSGWKHWKSWPREETGIHNDTFYTRHKNWKRTYKSTICFCEVREKNRAETIVQFWKHGHARTLTHTRARTLEWSAIKSIGDGHKHQDNRKQLSIWGERNTICCGEEGARYWGSGTHGIAAWIPGPFWGLLPSFFLFLFLFFSSPPPPSLARQPAFHNQRRTWATDWQF